MHGDRLRVGIATSLSGQFASQGRQALEGVNAWVEDTNAAGGVHVPESGRKLQVQLVHYDDNSSVRVAESLIERLIRDDRVDLLLGPYSSVLTLAAARIAEAHERLLWNHGGASDQIFERGYRWVVGVLSPASSYLTGVVDMVRELDPAASRLAILRSGKGTFSANVCSGAQTRAEQLGFDTVFNGVYDPDTVDFRQLVADMEETSPDVVLTAGRIPDDLALARGMAQTGVKAKAVALIAAGIAQFGAELGSGASGFMGPSQWEPALGHVVEYGPSFVELALRHPPFVGADYPMAQAYAACLVAQKCIEEAGTLEDRELRKMANRLEFTTFFGRFKIDPSSGLQIGLSVVIVQWQGGDKLVVWPPELRQAEPIYPARWARHP